MKFWLYALAAVTFVAALVISVPVGAYGQDVAGKSTIYAPLNGLITLWELDEDQPHEAEFYHVIQHIHRAVREAGDCRDKIKSTTHNYLVGLPVDNKYRSFISYADAEISSTTTTVSPHTAAECVVLAQAFVEAALHAAARHTAINRVSRAVNEVADACAVAHGHPSYLALQARAESTNAQPDKKVAAAVTRCNYEIATVYDHKLDGLIHALDQCQHGRDCLTIGEELSTEIKTKAERHLEGEHIRNLLHFPEPEPEPMPMPMPEMTTPTVSVSTATVSTSTPTDT